jgi:hypothetical protein
MKKIIFCFLSLIVIASCGYRQGVIIVEPGALLVFVGNTDGAIVQIDKSTSFVLSNGGGTSIKSDTGEKDKQLDGTHYLITPGKHRIQVLKNDEIVVDRELLISDGITREIFVP